MAGSGSAKKITDPDPGKCGKLTISLHNQAFLAKKSFFLFGSGSGSATLLRPGSRIRYYLAWIRIW